MVKEVDSKKLLPIRQQYLRPTLKVEECEFPTDDLTDTLHLGCFEGKSLVSIGSFHRETYQNDQGLGYRIRGMATAFEERRKGFASQLLEKAISDLGERGVDYIWCNARRAAYQFYEKYGFKYLSKEFEIEGIGPHRVMMLKPMIPSEV